MDTLYTLPTIHSLKYNLWRVTPRNSAPGVTIPSDATVKEQPNFRN